MAQANIVRSSAAYLMEALCILGAGVMLWFFRALVAEGKREGKATGTPSVAPCDRPK